MALTLVFNDTFTETSDTNLTSHTPDTGTGWTALTNSIATNARVNGANDLLEQPFYAGTGFSFYVISVGASQDDAQASELTINNGGKTQIGVRLQDGSTGVDGYVAELDTGNGNVRLYRLDESVETELAASFQSAANGDTLKLEIDASGNIEVFHNSTSVITHTDNTYTGGLPGVTLNKTSTDSGDNFSAWMGEAGTTVNATSAGINVSTFVATVTVGNDTNVSATLASINVSTFAATVTTNSPTNVNATSAGINVSTNAATVTQVYGIVTEPLKNNTDTVLASTGSIIANVYNLSTGALVVRKTGLTSDANGVIQFTDASLSASTTYLVLITVGSSDGVARIATGA